MAVVSHLECDNKSDLLLILVAISLGGGGGGSARSARSSLHTIFSGSKVLTKKESAFRSCLYESANLPGKKTEKKNSLSLH